jgi:hypothetical protein
MHGFFGVNLIGKRIRHAIKPLPVASHVGGDHFAKRKENLSYQAGVAGAGASIV